MSISLEPNISITDQSLSRGACFNYILTVQLSFHGLSFCILDAERHKYISLASYTFQRNIKAGLIDQIEQVIESNDLLKEKFKSSRVIVESPDFTFIPEPLFEKEKASLYLEFNNNVESDNTQIFSDKLINLEAYNVYAVPNMLVDAWQTYFPEAAVSHFLSSLIESLLIRYKNIPVENRLFAYVRSHYFDIVFIDGNRLKYCNSFMYRSKEDLAYFLIFVFEQLQLNPENVCLKLMGEIVKASVSFDFLYRYIRNIDFEGRNEHFKYSYQFDELPGHSFYNLLNANLCEL